MLRITPTKAARRLALSLLICLAPDGVTAQAEPDNQTELRKTDHGFVLLRNGEPYVVKGAGAVSRLEEFAAAGGNSIRTWGAGPELGPLLDEAHRHGLTVTVGLWLEHKSKGMDYDDPEMVADQLEDFREQVRMWKDHPALLVWGVGNEVALWFGENNPNIWKAHEQVAQMIAEEDPGRPTMIVIAELGERKIEYIREYCPSIDIIGINSYGGAASVGERYHAHGLDKPYMITEFGAFNHYELPRTAWDVAIEQTSTQRARSCLLVQQVHSVNPHGKFLGSYWFYWGGQDKDIPGWHSAFLKSGATLGTFDAMTYLWSGAWPDNLAPQLEELLTLAELDGMTPGSTFSVQAIVYDTDNDGLTATWELRPERPPPSTWGDHEPPIGDPIEGAIVESSPHRATIRVPDKHGPYRLYYVVTDTNHKAATGSVALRVGERE
ncbi:MAG: glycoside hydrolase family 2 TIM barrel-domain containing protein [Planctomycetota bacterium]